VFKASFASSVGPRPAAPKVSEIPYSAVRSPQSAVRSPQSTVHSPQSAVRSPQSTPSFVLQFAPVPRDCQLDCHSFHVNPLDREVYEAKERS